MSIFEKKKEKADHEESVRMHIYGTSTLGESHKRNGKPMQDASLGKYFGANNENIMLIVSDGHGSDRYFRSDVGAQLAVEVAAERIERFVEEWDYDPLWEEDCVARGTNVAISEEAPDYTPRDPHCEELWRYFFENTVATWRDRVEKHWKENPPAPDQPHYDSKEEIEEIIETYGCTLLSAVCTPKYWFAFQLGDGTIVAMDDEARCRQVVPWDSQCGGYGEGAKSGATTSLCAFGSESFRYIYGRKVPGALFVASDGIDDSKGGISEGDIRPPLGQFYRRLVEYIKGLNYEWPLDSVKEQLDALGKNGSRDDMSLQMWLSPSWADGMAKLFAERNKEFTLFQIKEEEQRLEGIKTRIDSINARKKALETALGETGLKYQEGESILEDLRQEEPRKKGFLDLCEKSLARLASAIADLEQFISKLQAKLQEYKNERTKRESEKRNAEQELQSHQEKMKQQQRSNSDLAGQMERNRTELRTLERDLRRDIDERDRIEEYIKKLKSNVK